MGKGIRTMYWHKDRETDEARAAGNREKKSIEWARKLNVNMRFRMFNILKTNLNKRKKKSTKKEKLTIRCGSAFDCDRIPFARHTSKTPHNHNELRASSLAEKKNNNSTK